ncbi:ATP-dependent zinc protease family protein [Rhodopirellula sp. P2]|uniref:ATP-dependent zinc protease family protein n=1 Tax=Rhodopirellula sp. P2 TaxID=2127060 RepID=UPI002367CA69|nr:RimK/LysX family protein [Rhodopirellula sp. P2]WDQ18663.1 RimK/LysX family protein [Rhodopirellula sp. P2]
MTNDPSRNQPSTESTGSKLLPTDPLVVIGWREWVGLPELKVRHVKAKIDTGARSSSLHAFDVDTYFDQDVERVRFSIHPVQQRDDLHIEADVPILERRHIRSSNGNVSERIVIRTPLEILRRRVMVDLTLANRDSMGFRMLVGREAIRNRFLVDCGASFLAGRRKRKRSGGTEPPQK